ncbi:MAG: hypothetical protein HRU15_18625 [Planctomycetes bacterium]|nr:hypothetical protein [Planctomycetota bacterium]
MNNPGYDIQDADATDATDATYGVSHNIPSAANNKEFPALIFTPSTGDKTEWPVVYQLHGSNSQPLTDAGLRAMYHAQSGMQQAADFFQVIIVCVLTGNMSYLDAPKDPTVKIATFISQELVAYVDKNMPSIADRNSRVLAGFSMGGGGAVRLLCQYPDVFSLALSRGGAMDPAFPIIDLDWDDVHEGSKKLLGDYWGTDRKNYHTASCMNLINHIRDRDDVGIVMEVGTEDFLYKCNRRLRARLQELNFPHIYAEYPEGHQWGRQQLFSLYTHMQYFKQTC